MEEKTQAFRMGQLDNLPDEEEEEEEEEELPTQPEELDGYGEDESDKVGAEEMIVKRQSRHRLAVFSLPSTACLS